MKELEVSHKRISSTEIWQKLIGARAQVKLLDNNKAEYVLLRARLRYYEGVNMTGKLWLEN